MKHSHPTRRDFFRTGLTLGTAAAASGLPLLPPALPAEALNERLTITGIRMGTPTRKKPWPEYEPAPGAWTPLGVEVASPMSIYPKYKARRDSFFELLGPYAVEITTDKGIRGIGIGGDGVSYAIEKHFRKLLLGENALEIERLWDIMWRSSMYYGRKGMVIHSISAIDNALWDIAGQAMGVPVYRLLGGKIRDRVPAYATSNDVEHLVNFGYKHVKLAMPHGPASGHEGMRKNVELVERARNAVGPDGEIMLDCWMAGTERYMIELAEMLEPYRVYWMEECLHPDDYAGFGRLRNEINSTRIATGEHEYTRYGFKLLLDYKAADLWQPDMNWCGGLTELRRIAALAAANDIPLIPHAGWSGGCQHFIIGSRITRWCEMLMPPPGGPEEVYAGFEEENNITRGPEGIYVRPPDRPGLGWEIEVV